MHTGLLVLSIAVVFFYVVSPIQKQAGKNLLLHQPNKDPDFWGVDMTMEIGEDQIVYSAVRGSTMPAILYLPAFDAPSDDQKAERIRS